MNQEDEETVIEIIRKQLICGNEEDWTLDEYAQTIETKVIELNVIEGFGYDD